MKAIRASGMNTVARGKKSFKKGFTLLEVILGLSIFAVAMLSIEPLVITAMRYDKDTWFKVKVRELAIQKLDDIVAQTTLTCDGVVRTEYIDAETGAVSATPSGSFPVSRTWTISPVPVTESPNLCDLKTTVTYWDKHNNNAEKTIGLMTQRSR